MISTLMCNRCYERYWQCVMCQHDSWQYVSQIISIVLLHQFIIIVTTTTTTFLLASQIFHWFYSLTNKLTNWNTRGTESEANHSFEPANGQTFCQFFHCVMHTWHTRTPPNRQAFLALTQNSWPIGQWYLHIPDRMLRSNGSEQQEPTGPPTNNSCYVANFNQFVDLLNEKFRITNIKNISCIGMNQEYVML